MMLGQIWAARNDGGTGDPDEDMANSVLGTGNVWQADPEKAAKLDQASPDYSP